MLGVGGVLVRSHIYMFFFSIPFLVLVLLFSLPPTVVVTQIYLKVTKQALLPLPHYGTRLHFYREKSAALSSLVDSRRNVLTHAINHSRQ